MKATIYIVDDEPMAVQYLETLLLGMNIDVMIIGSASNGVEAIPEIERLRPDFIFADISMPVMDGITMSVQILKRNPMQKIFILTAYQDFEYAKKSIGIGVADYLLKNELSEQMLEKIIKKYSTILELEKREIHAITATNIRKFLLSKNIGDQIGITFQRSDKYALIYIVKKPTIVLRYSGKPDTVFIDCYEMESSILDKEIRCKIFMEVITEEYCCVLSANKSIGDFNKKIFCIADNIIQRMNWDTHRYICMVSEPVDNFFDLSNKYEELKKKTASVSLGKDSVYFEKDVYHSKPITSGEMLSDLLEKWIDLIEKNNIDLAQDALEKYLYELKIQCDNWGYKERIQSLYYFFQKKIKEKGIMEDFVEIESSYYDIEKMEQDFLKSQERCLRESEDKRKQQYSKHIILAQQFIEEHYSQDISVADIAEATGISEGHLRRCFKTEINESVINYLTNYRIHLAKKMMVKENKNIEEICKQVGFTSGQYFSYVFKKKEGISPSDYMRKVYE